jgi:hypothetical protein
MKDYSKIFWAVLSLFFLFIVGCENEYPDSVFNYEYSTKPTPVITNVDPQEVSFSGIGVITITGSNFSAVPTENHVYFSGAEGTTLAASETELTVKVPAISIANRGGDSVKIKLRVDGAYLFATYGDLDHYPYILQKAALEYTKVDTLTHDLLGLALDLQENIYLFNRANENVVIIFHPDSQVYNYGTATSGPSRATGMKMGPDGYLYILKGNNNVLRIPPGGGDAETFVRANERVNDLDFDQNLNIFAAGDGQTIECVKQDASTFTAADYTDYDIDAVRVYDGYVYVYGEYDGSDPDSVKAGIWKNEIINANGDLGPKELVFDWGAYSGDLGPTVLCFTILLDGRILIGQSKDDALVILDPVTSQIEPFYSEILEPPYIYISWGNGTVGNYLYVNRHADSRATWQLLQVAMNPGYDSAPYYGRQ